MRRPGRKKKSGFTLAELLVSVALLTSVTTAVLVLYSSAFTEFEHASGTMTLNQRARETVDRVSQILKTAAPAMNAETQAFIHPNNNDLGALMYEADFLSTICFIPVPTFGSSWEVTDKGVGTDPPSAAFREDPPRYIYETDESLTTFVTRVPSLYRYRIAWNHLSTPLVTKGRNVPARAVYFERLSFAKGGTGALGWGEGPNTNTYSLAPFIADTGTPISPSITRARILGRNVHSFTLQRTTGNVILMRLRMYNRDPETLQVVDGMTMRRPQAGGGRDMLRGGAQRLFMVDLTTNIHLPNMLRSS